MNPIHIYRTILSAAGEQAPVLKRCLRDSVIAANLQGASFALLVPICLALGAGNNRAAVLWLLALTALLILSSIFRWRAQDYDYHGNCARAGDTMRRHLGEHLRRIPLQILYRQRSGELNALLAATIDETYNHTLIVSNMLIAAVFTPLATALLTLIWDWRLGLILLISFPLIVPIQPRTQRRGGHTGAGELDGQPLGEPEHPGLVGRVGTYDIVCSNGGDVENGAASAPHHGVGRRVGGHHDCPNHDVEGLLLAGQVSPDEALPQPEAGVIDQEPYGFAWLTQTLGDELELIALGQVGLQDLHLDAGELPHLLSHLPQALGGARNEDEVMTRLGKLPGELQAEAARGPGDKRCSHDGRLRMLTE